MNQYADTKTPVAPDEPPLRVMSLHALAYCERLFYLEEVEEIRVADHAVYAGRTLHEELRQAEEETGEWSSAELSSEKLGLVGKVDCLRRRDGSVIPYEHKRGRPRRDGKKPTAWPSDALQVSAYGMLLEEQTVKVRRKYVTESEVEDICRKVVGGPQA